MVANLQGLNVANKSRFYSLDGLRGVAAILVMIFHYSSHNGLHLLRGAYVAVDVFFILSGFVLIHSYGKQIASGMTFKRFITIRLLRLYPLFILGVMIGLCALIYDSYHLGTLSIDQSKIKIAMLLNMLLIPYLNHEQWSFDKDNFAGIIFPLNDPGWSLFFELFVNIIFFIYIHKYKKLDSKLLYFVAFSYLIFIAVVIGFKTPNPGWGTHNFLAGFPRVVAEFFMGILIYQQHNRFRIGGGAIVIAAISFFIIVLGSVYLSLLNTFIFAPLLILMFANLELKATAIKICSFLGDLSYPLYIIHVPVFRFLLNFTMIHSLSPVLKVALTSAIALTLSTFLIAIDRSVRKRLSIALGLDNSNKLVSL